MLNQGTSKPESKPEASQINGDMACVACCEELEELVELDDVQLATVVAGRENERWDWDWYQWGDL